MPEQAIQFLADQNYLTGAQELAGPIAIDDDIRALKVIIDRSSWTGRARGLAVRWVMELSRDGGPWHQISEGATEDGISRNDQNIRRTRSVWRMQLPLGPREINRRVRIATTISQDVTTGGVLQTLIPRRGRPD